MNVLLYMKIVSKEEGSRVYMFAYMKEHVHMTKCIRLDHCKSTKRQTDREKRDRQTHTDYDLDRHTQTMT